MSVDAKSVILSHRSYRKISASARPFVLQFFFIALPLSLVVVFFYPEITKTVCLIARTILSQYFQHDSLGIVSYPYIIGDACYITLPGRFPSILFSLINAIVSLLLLVLLPRIRALQTAGHFLHRGLVYTFFYLRYFLSSCLINFHIRPPTIRTSISNSRSASGFLCPSSRASQFCPCLRLLPSKMITMLATLVYSLVFGTVRYVVFLFIIGKISLLYMAILFFVLGPLVDFVYIVGIYSVYAARLAKKIKGNFTLWKWSY